MEIKNAIEHRVKSFYKNCGLEYIQNPKSRLEMLTIYYSKALILLEDLKGQRDNKNIPDYMFFDKKYSFLFDLCVKDIEEFSKLILGENVSRIGIRQRESEERKTKEGKIETVNIVYNALSKVPNGRSNLRRHEIAKLLKEREIFLIGKPLFSQNYASIYYPYGYKHPEEIYYYEGWFTIPSNDVFTTNDYDCFNTHYKDVLKTLRHSLTDQEIDASKEELRITDFDTIIKSFDSEKKEYPPHSQQAHEYYELKKEAYQYRNGRILTKKPRT